LNNLLSTYLMRKVPTYKPTFTDAIWNRACEGGGPDPKEGDAALAALLLFHGVAMNGGVTDALETLSDAQISAAQAAFCYFDVPQIAALIIEARDLLRARANVADASFDERYWAFIPDDAALEKRFVAHYTHHPDAYSKF
jgi:hypothetical protein